MNEPEPKALPLWQDWLKALILLGMGFYFVFLITSRSLVNYINVERVEWVAYAGAALFLLLGGWSIYNLLRRKTTLNYSHARITPSAMLVMAVPLLFALVPSRPLGVEAVTGGVSLNPVGASTVSVYEKPALERNILDWLREFSKWQHATILDHQPVDVIGFVYREPDMTATQFMVARFTVSCCVADAFAVGMPVDYEKAADLQEGDWIRVQGELLAGQFQGQAAPIIRPERVEIVEAPAAPYLYP
jgi:uncharacterized repeat protein (TIGR03943 family)